MTATLLISTYNMPRHLDLVCAALERQTVRGVEIAFCDDGSGPETASIIQRFQKNYDGKIHHLWQEHAGFRKCRILNEGLRRTSGDTLIFLDGDCIPHRSFIEDHLRHQEAGTYLAGRRVELGPKISAQITRNWVERGFFDFPNFSLIRSSLEGDTQHINRALRIQSSWLRKLLKMDHVVDLKGCNYSVPRKILESINGFDEAYEGYGREDTDIEVRLQNAGLRIKSLKGLALQYHVWHPRRVFTPANDDRLLKLKAGHQTWCQKGLIPHDVNFSEKTPE